MILWEIKWHIRPPWSRLKVSRLSTNLTSGLALLLLLSADPLLLGPLGATLLLQGGSRNTQWTQVRPLLTGVSSSPGKATHDPVLERDQLLLLLLPALEVSIDQGLQLDQVLVLTFLLDVLRGRKQTSAQHKHPEVVNPSAQRFTAAYIKVHLLTIGDLGGAGPAGESGWDLSLDRFLSQKWCECECVRAKLTWTLASPLQVRRARGDKYMSSG